MSRDKPPIMSYHLAHEGNNKINPKDSQERGSVSPGHPIQG